MKQNTYLAVYPTLPAAEQAVTQLHEAGFDMACISIAGSPSGVESSMVGCYNTGTGVQYFGEYADIWARIAGPMNGWGNFWSPKSGPIVVTGPLVQAIITGQKDRTEADDLSDFCYGLSNIGIPAFNCGEYEAALMANQWLLFVMGEINQVDRAHHELKSTNPLNGTLHHAIEENINTQETKG